MGNRAQPRGEKALRQRLRAAIVTGIIRDMARCTAPVHGHRTASGRAACPACGGSGRYGYGYGSPYSSYTPSYTPSYTSSGSSARPRWSRAGSSVAYTTTEVRALTPVRETVEKQVPLPEGRDFFLCHAWDDRAGAAKSWRKNNFTDWVRWGSSTWAEPLGASGEGLGDVRAWVRRQYDSSD